jgi:hypothetical protein
MKPVGRVVDADQAPNHIRLGASRKHVFRSLRSLMPTSTKGIRDRTNVAVVKIRSCV